MSIWTVVAVIVAYEFGRQEEGNAVTAQAAKRYQASLDPTNAAAGTKSATGNQTAAGQPQVGAAATNPQGSSAFSQ